MVRFDGSSTGRALSAIFLVSSLALGGAVGCTDAVPEFVQLFSDQPTKDTLTVTVSRSAIQPAITATMTLSFDVTFSEAIDRTSFTIDDFKLGGTSAYTISTIANQGDDIHFRIRATATTIGSVDLTIPQSVISSSDGTLSNNSSTNVKSTVSIVAVASPVPPDVVSFTASALDNDSVLLSWVSGEGSTLGYKASYLIGSSAPADCDSGIAISAATIGANTSFNVSGLNSNSTYTFLLCAINDNSTPDVSAGVNASATTAVDPSISFNASLGTFAENSGTINVPISLSGPSGKITAISYSIVHNSTDPSDFNILSAGTLTLAAGVTLANVSIAIIDDSIPELSENFSITLNTPGNTAIGARSNYNVFITENDLPAVSFTTSSIRADEGSPTISLTLTLSHPTAFNTSVDLAVDGGAGGTAAIFSDFVNLALPQTLLFLPGQTTKAFLITIANDTLSEGIHDEFLGLKLQGANFLNYGTQVQSKIYIRDNDYCKGFNTLDYPFANSRLNPAGTDADPFTICTHQQLNLIGTSSLFWDKSFTLMADIDMSSYGLTEYKIIGNGIVTYKGVFNGNQYKVSNLGFNGSIDYVGFLGSLGPTGVLKDLQLENINFIGKFNVGAAVGKNGGSIERIKVTGSSSVLGSQDVGGIVGAHIGGVIRNSHSNADVLASNFHAGGIAGRTAGSSLIIYSYSSGNISGADEIGGLVGDVTQTSSLSYNFTTADVTGNSSSSLSVGLLFGGKIDTPSLIENYVLSTANCINDGAGLCRSDGYQIRALTSFSDNSVLPTSQWDSHLKISDGLEGIWDFENNGITLPTLNWPLASSSAETAQFIFATSTVHAGDMGGLANADTICNFAAADANTHHRVKIHNYVAILSTANINAISRFSPFRPIYLPSGLEGDFVTENIWGDVTLDTAIQMDEKGNTIVASFETWTGTTNTGITSSSALNCSDWTVASSMATHGLSNSVNSVSWISENFSPCSTLKRLYCVSID